MTDYQRIFVVGAQAGADEVARLRSSLGSDVVVLTAPTVEAKRVVTGLGVGALVATTGAIVSEFAPPGKKNLCNAIVYSGVPFGSLLAALLAILLLAGIGWRGMFWIGALPIVTLLPLAFFKMPESPSWLLARGRVDDLGGQLDTRAVLEQARPDLRGLAVARCRTQEQLHRLAGSDLERGLRAVIRTHGRAHGLDAQLERRERAQLGQVGHVGARRSGRTHDHEHEGGRGRGETDPQAGAAPECLVATLDDGRVVGLRCPGRTRGRSARSRGREPIDQRGPVNATQTRPIHREAPEFTDLTPKAEVFETGIKIIDLLTPFIRGGKAGLFGGAGDDRLFGDAGSDQLSGGAGNDVLDSGGGGVADILRGGSGVDTVDYGSLRSRVEVDLDFDGINATSEGRFESLSEIEVIRATSFADLLVGDAFANQFFGRAGADVIDGGQGDEEAARPPRHGVWAGVVAVGGAAPAASTDDAGTRTDGGSASRNSHVSRGSNRGRKTVATGLVISRFATTTATTMHPTTEAAPYCSRRAHRSNCRSSRMMMNPCSR